MKIEEVKKYIDLAKEEGVSKLSVEDGDKKISISFQSGYQPVQTHMPASLSMSSAPVNGANSAEVVDGHIIKAPFVGTFYDSPAPDKPAFAKVGDKVSKGQTLCILEAMKIMNEIEADVSGEIVEICLPNESLVEFGEALFKIRV